MQKETLEGIEMMDEKIIEMERRIEALNEKQNKEGNRGMQDARTDDSSKQIPIAGL